ncbi:MAG: thioredoxin family protein [Chitinispirillia bacterium]|nr:thioredoxin family protein [Chitinispirillia bacterium]MCL2269020.1 thioredoxin family protein [Chitinispirillia bacterium]
MARLKILTIFQILLLSVAAFAQDRSGDLALEALAGKAAYRAGDTVVVGVRAVIPPNYHLYANPLGPGIGKPLNLVVNKVNLDWRAPWKVEWTEARKSVPKRYQPPIGSWVWAYDTEAFFFVKGILTFDAEAYKTSVDSATAARDSIQAAAAARAAAKTKVKPPNTRNAAANRTSIPADTVQAIINSTHYEVIVDALICYTACVPIWKSTLFSLTVSADTAASDPSAAFPAEQSWQARYARSEPMEFRIGLPEDTPSFSSAAAGEDGAGINLGLIGLNGAARLPPADASAAESPPVSQNEGGDGKNWDGENWNYTPLEENKREYGFLTAVIFALIAGLAMNLTPCIFPVLSIRILSFAESAGESRRQAVTRSAAFAGGIVAVFLLLAALAAFAGFSWGQQFQNPGIMVGIIAIIFLFALGMFDFYTMIAPPAIANAGEKTGATLAGDFLKGAAATVMATPCAGPFLGGLLAWALLQKPLTIFTLFAVMGVGMAAPYVLLSSSKKLMALLPKPGRWIEDMKYAMGFLLLVFAVLLMKSLDPRLTLTAIGICLSILCAASVNKRFGPFGAPVKQRVTAIIIALTMITAGAVLSVKYLRLDIPLFSDDQIGLVREDRTVWQEFTPQALATAQREGRSVIVNFTAQWCSNCKINKAAVLDAPETRELYIGKNIALLSADITNHNTPAQNLLHHLGSRSVPFLAIFPSDSPANPIIMRDILSKDKYIATLNGLP